MTERSVPGVPPEPSPGPPARVRVASIDDDTLIREGLRVLLPDLNVVGAYARVEDFLSARPDVDVVLVDLKLVGAAGPPTLQGMRGVEAVVQAGYRTIIYTNEQRRHVLAGCLAYGALGVVQKADPLTDLSDAVTTVAGGGVVITTALAGLVETFTRRGRMAHLPDRQAQVLQGRARGESYKSIAKRLFLSPKTVEGYMSDVSKQFADYLADHSEADLELMLGIGPGDLLSRE